MCEREAAVAQRAQGHSGGAVCSRVIVFARVASESARVKKAGVTRKLYSRLTSHRSLHNLS